MWPIASFRGDTKVDRYRGMADLAGLATGSTRSRMTRSRHWYPSLTHRSKAAAPISISGAVSSRANGHRLLCDSDGCPK